MFDTLFSTWRTFRSSINSERESDAFEPYSDFEDACLDVAEGGQLDQAAQQARRTMDNDDAGDFYGDLLNFASQCDLEATAGTRPAMINSRVFSIPAMGEMTEMAQLHGNVALVKSVRGSGFATGDSQVLVLGAVRMDNAARLSPQSLWNLVNHGAKVLAKMTPNSIDHGEIKQLRDMAPVMPFDRDETDDDDIEVGSAVLMGLRVTVEMGDDLDEDVDPDTLPMDALDDPSEETMELWSHQVERAMPEDAHCAVMIPMPWRDGLVQAIVMSAEAQILIEADGGSHSISKMTVAPTHEGISMAGFAADGMLMGTYHVPRDVSFWVLADLVAQLQGQGMDVDLKPPFYLDLATMPSPGKLLN